MNLDPVEARLGRAVTDEEAAAFFAVKPLLDLLSGRDYGIGWMREDSCEGHANWYGFAVLTGARITTCYCTTPGLAADTLAELLLASLRCPRCGHRICAVAESGWCLWQRVGSRWSGSCTFTEHTPLPTRKDNIP